MCLIGTHAAGKDRRETELFVALLCCTAATMTHLRLCCLSKACTESLGDGSGIKPASVLLVVYDDCRQQDNPPKALANAVNALCIILRLQLKIQLC